MSEEEKRNILIFEMKKISSYSYTKLQQFPTQSQLKSLVGFAFISVFLKLKGIRTVNELALMTYEEQRNALIVELIKIGGYEISQLKKLGDFNLYDKGIELIGNQGILCTYRKTSGRLSL